jgi:adenylate cyclase
MSDLATELAAQVWCTPETERIEMDVRLAQAMANTIKNILADKEKAEAKRDRLQAMVDQMWALICESKGVDGLHLNGDTAPWETLMAGGYFEDWLPSWALEDKP